MLKLVSTCVLGGVLLTGVAAASPSESTAVSARVAQQTALAAETDGLSAVLRSVMEIAKQAQ